MLHFISFPPTNSVFAVYLLTVYVTSFAVYSWIYGCFTCRSHQSDKRRGLCSFGQCKCLCVFPWLCACD